MKTVIVIPARMKSSRFLGKPLANILGLPMIEHVRRRALFTKGIERVLVATCDEEIHALVRANNGDVVMTSDKHIGCVDRIAEAIKDIETDLVVNLQGDEPMVLPEMIYALIEPFKIIPDLFCSSLMMPINNIGEFQDANVIKVVTDKAGYAIYFSREPVPSKKKMSLNKFNIMFKQTGLYAYRKDFLLNYTKLKPLSLEIIESIDILRALEYGYKVKMIEFKGRLIGVDIPDDIKKVEEELQKDKLLNKYLKIEA